MKCLNDILCGKYSLVGIRDFVHCAHPETMLWVNDISGITLKSAAAIANDEQRTAFNLLNDKIILATKKVFNKFSYLVSGSFDFNAFIESREIRNFSSSTHLPAAIERGLSLRRSSSEMAKIFIEELYIKVEETGIAYVKIYDGDVTKIYAVSLLANITNVVTIRYKCENEHVTVVFDQTHFTTYSCKIKSDSGCHSCGQSYQESQYLDIMGWDGSDEVDECYGMGILANVQCFEEEILCQLLPRMNFMIYYQSGIEIFSEHISGSRVNSVATFGKEQAREDREECRENLKIEEEQFAKNINYFLKQTRGDCFSCNGNKSVFVIP